MKNDGLIMDLKTGLKRKEYLLGFLTDDAAAAMIEDIRRTEDELYFLEREAYLYHAAKEIVEKKLHNRESARPGAWLDRFRDLEAARRKTLEARRDGR